MASTHDYIYRSDKDLSIVGITMWEFVATQETCDLKNSGGRKSDDELSTHSEDYMDLGGNDLNSVPEKIELNVNGSRPIHFFQQGHPSYKTKGHRQRTRRTWPKYSAKRLPVWIDLQDDSELTDEDRNEKRELYGQGVLIMFYPFRKISDLKDEDENWCAAYLKRKDVIESNSTSLRTLKSIQNFYESFFRSGTQQEEQNLSFDYPHQSNNIEDSEEEVAEVFHLLDDDQQLHQSSVLDDFCRCTNDPFVKKLISLEANPLQIDQSQSEQTVTLDDAIKAIHDLPRSGRPFLLPNRAKLGDVVSDNSSSDDPLKKNILDQPIGTRIDLLTQLERALRTSAYSVTACDGSEPDVLEADFPTLDEQSKHWTLNEKQHQAFLLGGAAFLQHISNANAIDPSQHTVSSKRITTAIKEHLKKLLPKDGQLIMYLGGSGGTGKSRVIRAFVDFSRRWHATTSTVITASSGVAAILIGGCTIHSALGIAKSMKLSDPSPSMIQASSEVGIMLIDEFGFVKADLYDLIDLRL